MLKIIPFAAAVLLALSLPLTGQDGGPVLRIIETQDQIIRIRAKTRHTSVIVLPATENRAGFRGGGFGVLAPDRSGQPGFPQNPSRRASPPTSRWFASPARSTHSS